MSLSTFSAFYYGHEITVDNNLIDFNEGGSDLQAELNVGAYTLTEFIVEIKRAMEAAGGLTYTVTVNRTNRKITIAGSSTFSLLCNSGDGVANSAWSLIGFLTTSDKTGTNTYASDSGSGSEYIPQFILQDHVDPNHWTQAVDSSVNRAANGTIEVVKFGEESFLQCEISYANNYSQTGEIIRNNATGIADLVAFMNYIIKKAPIEYMASIDDRTTYISLILETTAESKTGTGFRLIEMYDRGLPGYFETGTLKFRVY